MIVRTVVPAAMLALAPLIWVPTETAGDILLLVATGASWAFTLLYLARSPWWARHVGRMLVAFTLAMSLVLTQNSVGTWWGDEYPYRGEIRDVLYAALAVTLIRLTLALVRLQNR
ncbi:putative phage holin [Mycobacteroides abscessus]|uniref:putative phage holin n=1 Tax=Mycobacteroides abscessus TaxID=36809 RepID=UPI000928B2C4|nr:hypothetical protein [Mycobacteroides abscessus]QSM04934.1 hypothetical protein PROPHIGD91-4_83 [Mycobacterium phage prophi91-4]MDO3335177.1 hypothetical protein [Mycobacteroides abscessus subsp. bolletii]QSM87789.1 hypothetical protein I3U44_18490 [Mycobacteroides abscessus subsp. bolletii]SIB02477.1 Uncharacterised protein [Mycobacteroides abscessus subsp. bolletii]SII68754.1 Uncharacterised protein [Mycobacteroides abscessus subsp. bolletii]